jgi:hypothetical protein
MRKKPIRQMIENSETRTEYPPVYEKTLPVPLRLLRQLSSHLRLTKRFRAYVTSGTAAEKLEFAEFKYQALTALTTRCSITTLEL